MGKRINIIAWNARGFGVTGTSVLANNYPDTWTLLARQYMKPILETNSQSLLSAGLTESGSPKKNAELGMQCDIIDIGDNMKLTYQLLGWSNKAKNASRCSMASCQLYPQEMREPTFYSFQQKVTENPGAGLRPAWVSSYRVSSGNTMSNFMFYLVHLPSGGKENPKKLANLIRCHVSKYPDVPSIIAGDMNIDIQETHTAGFYKYLANIVDPNGGFFKEPTWQIIRSGYITYRNINTKKTSELDWAVTYKCKNPTVNPIGPIINSGAGKGYGYISDGISDHAMLCYSLEIE